MLSREAQSPVQSLGFSNRLCHFSGLRNDSRRIYVFLNIVLSLKSTDWDTDWNLCFVLWCCLRFVFTFLKAIEIIYLSEAQLNTNEPIYNPKLRKSKGVNSVTDFSYILYECMFATSKTTGFQFFRKCFIMRWREKFSTHTEYKDESYG